MNLTTTRTSSGIAVTSAGSGEAVLLLHGVGSSSRSFRYQLAGLSDEFFVSAWDAPGYRNSRDAPSTIDLDGYAGAVVDTLDDLGIARAHLVGVSWGGLIAQRVACSEPDRLLSLALIDSTVGRRNIDPSTAQAIRSRADRLDEIGDAQFASERAPKLVSASANEELVREIGDIMAESIRNPGYRSAIGALLDTDLTAQLETLAVATVVMCGTEDRITSLAGSRAIAERIPRSVLHTIDGAGHLSNQERPAEVNAILREHWKRHAKEGT